MKLKIVSGELKGRSIELPKSISDFRPTKSSVREAIASSLFFKIKDSNVADLCAGSGAFGIEMLSRGAKFSLFVELDTLRSKALEKNIVNLGIASERFSVENRSLRDYLSGQSANVKYDIIFCDPPYGDIALVDIVDSTISMLNPGGLLIFEREVTGSKQNRKLKSINVGEYIFKKRVYGRTEVLIYENKLESE